LTEGRFRPATTLFRAPGPRNRCPRPGGEIVTPRTVSPGRVPIGTTPQAFEKSQGRTKFLKLLAIVAMSIAMLTQASQAADTVPAKFRGTWVSAETKNDTPWTISSKTISHGPGSKCNITSVTPASEDGKAIIVAWKCPGYPNMLPAEVAWRLTKVN